MSYREILATTDAWVLSVLNPLAAAILVCGLDDLIVDLAWAAVWLKSKLRPSASLFPPGPRQLETAPRARIAIFLPLWREHAVIGRMLEHNLAAVRYPEYHIFAGCYPNDPGTQAAVHAVAACHPQVHLVLCPHDGPTSKADCLNWIYQHLKFHEDQTGERFEIVLTHDAEDLIHPEELRWINYYAARYDFVQTPVLPLPTSIREITHGVYCDEFAEYHTRDMTVRAVLGGFVPSCGVGTGYRRDALERLEAASGGRLFEPEALTEDYENGLRMFRLGCSQAFVPIVQTAGDFVATREYFPRSFASALRQRTRWTMGIALQGWQKFGWRGKPLEVYWLWRDRKGLIANPLSLTANLVFLYSLATPLWSTALWLRASGLAMQLAWATFALMALRAAVRMACSARVYGAVFALGVPVRAVYANVLNTAAAVQAVARYTMARVRGRPLKWLKTEHVYPDRTEIMALSVQRSLPRVTLEAAEIRLETARSLPRHAVARWKVLPFRVAEGTLHLASPEAPPAEAAQALREFTRLELQFHLVTPAEFDRLTGALL